MKPPVFPCAQEDIAINVDIILNEVHYHRILHNILRLSSGACGSEIGELKFEYCKSSRAHSVPAGLEALFAEDSVTILHNTP